MKSWFLGNRVFSFRRILGTAHIATALGIVALLFSTATAQGLDRVRRRGGQDSGKITKITALSVTVSKGGVEKEIPVEEIRNIEFSGEPDPLRAVRSAIKTRRYDEALRLLKEISRSSVDREIVLQEIDFLEAVCIAKLAFAGKRTLSTAIRTVADFVKNHRRSYRFTEALELLGTLQAAAGDHKGARKQFATLGKAPPAYFKARSAILLGRSLQDEGKHREAVAEFNKALAAAKNNTSAKDLVLEATLRRAVSQAADGDIEQATTAVKQIVEQADAEQSQLLAQAYNALGDCYLASDHAKAARDAFLHVDLLFSSAEQEHAKALHELIELWESLGHPSRAKDARERLQKQYPGSPWAKR